MKKMILLSIAFAISLKASAFKAEVYIHAFGRGNIYSKEAEVTYLNGDNTLVKIELPWGETIITHMANVVLVEQRVGMERKGKWFYHLAFKSTIWYNTRRFQGKGS